MAQAPSTLTTADYYLKEWYQPGRVESLALEGNAALDMFPRDTGFVGDVMPLPVILSSGQGIASSSLATAQTNSGVATGLKFNVTVGDTFGVIPLGSKALKAARNNMGAFLDGKKIEIDQFLNEMGHNLSIQLWGNGGGAIGQISVISATTDGTITLVQPDTIVNFWPGMVITYGEADGSGGSDTEQSGTAVVTTVDYNAGTFVFDGTLTSGDASDYLFREGQFSGATSQTILWKGVQAWCPSSAPSDTLFGLTRTGKSQLSGVRLTSGEEVGRISERLEKLATRMDTRYSSKPDCGFLHGEQWRALSRELQNQGTRPITVQNRNASFGYRALEMETGYGAIPIMSDRDCPPSAGFLFEKKHMKIWSMGDLIEVMNEDGLQMMRTASTAAYEIRYESYANFATPKPTAIGRVALPT